MWNFLCLALLIHLLPFTTLVFPSSLSKVYFSKWFFIIVVVGKYLLYVLVIWDKQPILVFRHSVPKQNWNFLCPLQPVSFNRIQGKWSALLHHNKLLFFLTCPCSSLLIWYFCETFQAVALLESVLTANFFILILRIIQSLKSIT